MHGMCITHVVENRVPMGREVGEGMFASKALLCLFVMAETTGKGSSGKDTAKTASQISPPSINLSKGGGAICSMPENSAANKVVYIYYPEASGVTLDEENVTLLAQRYRKTYAQVRNAVIAEHLRAWCAKPDKLTRRSQRASVT